MKYLDCVCNAGARARAGVRARDAKVYACDAGACVGVISEGCGWRIGVAVGSGWLAGWLAAGAPKVGGQGGPEREPKASAREWTNAG